MAAETSKGSPEQPVLRARARGEVSADAAFEELHALYGGNVRAWLALRSDAATAEDLSQDVWTVFYSRWQRWQFSPEMEAPEARPVLSFLYRTCQFVLSGYRKRQAFRAHSELDEAAEQRAPQTPEQLTRGAQFGQCLARARAVCPADELDVLLAKLAGLSLEEIAHSLGITVPVADHRFRNAIARVQKELQIAPQKGGKHA